jgi:G:T-mismatch repair DNA endonuclease (very short patch repair protein)
MPKKVTTKQFIERAIKVHGDKYDYSKTNYVNNYTDIIIICKKHGEFKQQPKTHIYQKSECPKCKKLKRLSTKEFIKRSNKIHDNKYNYSLTDYTNRRNKVKIICPDHGMFEQKAGSHMQGRGCSKCNIKTSSPELEIQEFLNNNKILFKKTDRSIIKPYELDIVIPSKRLAIEFNGRYWHSNEIILKRTNGKMNAQQYHQMKIDMCNKKGYHLHHIDEQDWIEDKQKELDKIHNLLL